MPGTNLRGIAVETVSNQLFWADNGSDKIYGATLSGESARSIISLGESNHFPADIRIDATARLLYWCDQAQNKIQRSNLDGTDIVTIISNATPTGPYFVEVDPVSQRLFWGDFDGGSIYASKLDGTGIRVLLNGVDTIRGISFDSITQTLYWVSRNGKTIQRCPITAMAEKTIPISHPSVETIYRGLDTPHGMAIDPQAGKIYWADTGTNPGNGHGERSINRGNLDGTGSVEILASGLEPWDLDIDFRVKSFRDWRARFFELQSPESESGPYADPDHDGLPNLHEYAHGLNPNQHNDQSVLQITTAKPRDENHQELGLIFTKRVNMSDLTISLETSADLEKWEIAPKTPWRIFEDSRLFSEGIEKIEIVLPTTINQQSAVYFRIKLTQDKPLP